jgi:hypothetical protein
MATIVRRLLAALLQGDKLIAQIDKGHGVALAAQLEIEETAVERERLFYVPHLQRHVVKANGSRLRGFGHRVLLCQPEDQLGGIAQDAITMIEWRSIVSLRALGLGRHAFASHVHPRRAQKPSSPSHEMNAQIISRRGRFPLHRPGLPGLFSFALPNGLARADRVPRFGELRRPQCRSPQRHIRTRLM